MHSLVYRVLKGGSLLFLCPQDGRSVVWLVNQAILTEPHVTSGAPPGSISHDFCHIHLGIRAPDRRGV